MNIVYIAIFLLTLTNTIIPYISDNKPATNQKFILIEKDYDGEIIIDMNNNRCLKRANNITVIGEVVNDE